MNRRSRGDATTLMKNAIGNAMTASMTVTDRATTTVRIATVRYSGSVTTLCRFAGAVGVHDVAGERVGRPERRHQQHADRAEVRDDQPQHRRAEQQRQPGSPLGRQERRDPPRAVGRCDRCRSSGTSPLDLLPLGHPGGVVGAVGAAAVDALLLRRRPVVDLARVASRRARGRSSQKFLSDVCLQASVCAGASPKYSATWAFTLAR